MIGLVYSNARHKVIPIPFDDRSDDEKRKARNAMRMNDLRLKQQQQSELARGFCPKCHCLLPQSCRCDCED